MPSSPGMLVGDAIPALLAVPDALAFVRYPSGALRSDDLVRRFTQASLTMFDSALLAKQMTALVRAKGPTEEIARIWIGEKSFSKAGTRRSSPRFRRL